MDDKERQNLRQEAADFRTLARKARAEAAIPKLEPWRQSLLQDSAEYYDRRADDAERRLLAARPAA